MKEYSTKEMKAGFEPSISDFKEAKEVKVKVKTSPDKALIEEKRGWYIVRGLNGNRLGKFSTKKDADNFIKKL